MNEFPSQSASAQAATIQIEHIPVEGMSLEELQRRLFATPCCMMLEDVWVIVPRIAHQDLALRPLKHETRLLTATTCSELATRMQEQEQTRNLLSGDPNTPFSHWCIASPRIEPRDIAQPEKGSKQ